MAEANVPDGLVASKAVNSDTSLPTGEPRVAAPQNRVEMYRGTGDFEMSRLRKGEFITASGKRDGGWIVWREAKLGTCDSVWQEHRKPHASSTECKNWRAAHPSEKRAGEQEGSTADPFSKGYTHRHGEPVSDACGDDRHFECTQDFTKCHCTMRGGHNDAVAPHAYSSPTGVQLKKLAALVQTKEARTAEPRFCKHCHSEVVNLDGEIVHRATLRAKCPTVGNLLGSTNTVATLPVQTGGESTMQFTGDECDDPNVIQHIKPENRTAREKALLGSTGPDTPLGEDFTGYSVHSNESGWLISLSDFMKDWMRRYPAASVQGEGVAPRPHLVHEAYKGLLKRAREYDDKDWESAQKFERHAINAALDLEAARKTAAAQAAEIASLKKYEALYAAARESLCSCNIVNPNDPPGSPYNYTCEWCEQHPEGAEPPEVIKRQWAAEERSEDLSSQNEKLRSEVAELRGKIGQSGVGSAGRIPIAKKERP